MGPVYMLHSSFHIIVLGTLYRHFARRQLVDGYIAT